MYAGTSVGNLSSDPLTRYLVAESVLRDGDLTIPESGLTVTPDGERHYSVFFPGQTIAMLPAAAVAEAGRAILGWPDAFATEVGSFLAAVVVIPFFAGLAVLGHVTLLRRLGASTRGACVGGLLTAFATAQWVWGSAASEEVIVGALAAWSMVGVLAGVRRLDAGPDEDVAGAANCFGLAGLLLAAGVVHRGTFLPIIVAAIVAALPGLFRHRGRIGALAVRLAPWFVASVVVASIAPLYNVVRFGDPFESGYGKFYESLGGLWATPVLTGLRGHLFSPGKSIFLYAPVLLLLVPAAASSRVRRAMGPVGLAVVAAVAVHLLIYSKTTYWAGAFGWAVRFHVCMMPMVMLPIALWLDRPRGGSAPAMGRATTAAVVALVALSVAVQLLGLSLNTGLETKQDRTAYAEHDHRIPVEAAWTWAHSPFRLRLENVGAKLFGDGLEPPNGDESFRVMTVWNIFPVRVAATRDGGPIGALAWGLWATILGGAVVTSVQLARRWPDAAERTDVVSPS